MKIENGQKDFREDIKNIFLNWTDNPKSNKLLDKTLSEATIDLRSQINYEKDAEYVKKWMIKDIDRFTKFYLLFPYIVKTLVIFWIICYLLLIFGKLEIKAKELNIKDKIRIERINICSEEFKKSWIKKEYIYGQYIVLRCATYMTLVYWFESNFWKSKKCRIQKNCFWIKWNGVSTPRWFLSFKTETQARKYFAKKYFKFHYKKKINTFVNNRSMTDRPHYKAYMRSKFIYIYNDLLNKYTLSRRKEEKRQKRFALK